MYDHPTQMEPLFPTGCEGLADLAIDIIRKSAALGGQLHSITRATIIDFLRIINSYYSNRIEGHNTHPVDIERAMRQEYADDTAQRALQIESRIHIEVQKKIEARLDADTELNVADSVIISFIHRQFYQHLPIEFRWISDPQTGRQVEIKAGELRTREVKVGHHIPPRYDKLPLFLKRFGTAYTPNRFHGANTVIAAAAAHHRLSWIHPFLDGNGRVTRLFTDAYLRQIPIDGYGLWTVSRGLARQRNDYISSLTWADAPRRNDYDGRGNLSNEGLIHFCDFFLKTCLDQIEFMSQLLQLDSLLERVRGYINLRKAKVIPPLIPQYQSIKTEAADLLQAVLLRGSLTRGEAARATQLPERTARTVIKQLLEERLLVSDSAKGRVRIGIPAAVVNYWFPNLYA